MSALDERIEELFQEMRQMRGLLEQSLQHRPELLTPKAAAAALSVSTKTVARMVQRGQLRTVQVGRHWRVPLSEVRRYSTPKQAAPRTSKRRAAEPYDVKAEYEKTMQRLGRGRAKG